MKAAHKGQDLAQKDDKLYWGKKNAMVQKSAKKETKEQNFTLVPKKDDSDAHKIRIDGDMAFVDDLEGELDPEDKGYLQLSSDVSWKLPQLKLSQLRKTI